jgi:hypothetical protein
VTPERVLATLAVGVVTGLLSGLLGIGGGLVSTPAIRLLLGYPALIAVGTPLAVIVPATLTGAWEYSRRRNVDLRAALTVGAIGAIAAIGGAALTGYVGGSVVLVLTALVILHAAWRLVAPAEPRPATGIARTGRLGLVGILAGLFSGFFGLGGGTVIIPGLIAWTGMPIRKAVGTSLVAITVIALPGIAVHAWLGHIDWLLAALLAAGVVPGAWVGARLAHRIDEVVFRRAFAVFLVLVAIVLAGGELMR